MFITALFTTTKKGKQPKYPTMDEWVNKTCYIHTMEYYAAPKRKSFILSNMNEP